MRMISKALIILGLIIIILGLSIDRNDKNRIRFTNCTEDRNFCLNDNVTTTKYWDDNIGNKITGRIVNISQPHDIVEIIRKDNTSFTMQADNKYLKKE